MDINNLFIGMAVFWKHNQIETTQFYFNDHIAKKKLRHKPEKETNNCLERQISINTEHICNSLGQCTVTTQIDMNHKIELQTLEVQPDKEIDSLKSFDSFLRFSLRISKNASFQLHALPGRIHHHCTL